MGKKVMVGLRTASITGEKKFELILMFIFMLMFMLMLILIELVKRIKV